MDRDVPARLVIVGGGVAALELVLAVRELVGRAVSVTMICPEPEFAYRPEAVAEPFGGRVQRYPLGPIADAMEFDLIDDRVVAVDDARSVVVAVSGRSIPYDQLVVAAGAHAESAFDHVTTILAPGSDQLRRAVRELEDGTINDVVLAVGARSGWTLPAYEVALLLAKTAASSGRASRVTLATYERQPLEVFGGKASRAVADLLESREVDVICGVREFQREKRTLTIQPDGQRLSADRVLALPALLGPKIQGLPVDEYRFVRVGPWFDVEGHPVRRHPGVWAIGDAASYPVKQGGVAAQQADVVAVGIAAHLQGAPSVPQSFESELRATLYTGDDPLYLSGTLVHGAVRESRVSRTRPDWATQKVAARLLTPFLTELDERGGVGVVTNLPHPLDEA